MDRQITELGALRKKLVSHIGWLRQRQRDAAGREKKSPSATRWPSTRKDNR